MTYNLHDLKILDNVTDWGGGLLDKIVLEKLKFKDYVRIISEDYGCFYAKIIKILPDSYLKGIISDPYYNDINCSICGEQGHPNNLLLGCECNEYTGDRYSTNCSFYIHKKCITNEIINLYNIEIIEESDKEEESDEEYEDSEDEEENEEEDKEKIKYGIKNEIQKNKECDCKLMTIPFQNGMKLIFNKNNISEIPHFTKNTKNFSELYPDVTITGFR